MYILEILLVILGRNKRKRIFSIFIYSNEKNHLDKDMIALTISPLCSFSALMAWPLVALVCWTTKSMSSLDKSPASTSSSAASPQSCSRWQQQRLACQLGYPLGSWWQFGIELVVEQQPISG